jgi:predicted nucleic acid-binding protein
MILLDTNILSELMRREPQAAVVTWLDAQPRKQLCLSAVTRAEIELGVAVLPEGLRKQTLREAADRVFKAFTGRCLPFDEAAAARYGEIVAHRLRAGRPICVEDAQIAATALVGGLVLATRNVRDFDGIEGLALVDPFSQQA